MPYKSNTGHIALEVVINSQQYSKLHNVIATLPIRAPIPAKYTCQLHSRIEMYLVRDVLPSYMSLLKCSS
jgi:hypothetical protein